MDQFTKQGDSVWDPFCGSGTSLVAGIIRKRLVVGSDIDVLAGLLSNVKCSPLPLRKYADWRTRFSSRLAGLLDEIDEEWPPESLPRPGRTLSIGALRLVVPSFPQLRYWFPPQVIAFLSAIAHAAHGLKTEHYEHVALVSLSAAIIAKWPNTLSYAMDIDHTRPHRRVQRFTKQGVLEAYLKRLDRTIECLGALHQAYRGAGVLKTLPTAVRVVCPHDARKAVPDLAADSQALVVTSPPYFNAVDYPRAHRMSVCWMNGHAPAELSSRREYLGLRHPGDFETNSWLQERKEIRSLIPKALRDVDHGRRVATFFADLDSVLEQAWRVLQPGGHAVFVIADNSIKGHRVKSHEALAELAKAMGFAEIHRKPRNIASVHRRFPVGTFGFDGPMTHEHVVILRKPKPRISPKRKSGAR